MVDHSRDREVSPTIGDAKKLAELVAEIRSLGSFALDTEFIRERTYRPRLCLIQVATARQYVIIDPLVVPDLTPFVELVLDPGIEKVLHSGSQDMEIFWSLSRRAPRTVVDTQVAAALAGRGETVSYARLVEDILGVKLSKVETYTDWSRRPLTPEQTEYAIDDVRYLYPLIDALRGELDRMGRVAWLAEELAFYEDAASYDRPRDDLYRKVRSAVKLEPRELAILRELSIWREEEAERLDWPRGRVLQDEPLVEIARRSPATLESIGAVRGIHPQLVRRSGQEILRRVARGVGLPESAYPAPIERASDDPELALIVDLLEVVLKSRAAEAKIAPSYLGTRKDLAELARRELRGSAPPGGGSLPVLSGWRRELVGESLLELLRGRSKVEVDPSRPRVSVAPRS